MSRARLLYIRSRIATVEIYGPTVSKWGIVKGFKCDYAHLQVEADDELQELVWTDTTGNEHNWNQEKGGPFFFEETNYQVKVKSHNNLSPTLFTRDPNLFSDIDVYADEHLLVGLLNFRRQAGLCRLVIVIGDRSIQLTIEVFPVKLDYEADYHVMINDITSTARALAFEYLRATFNKGGFIDRTGTDLDWITILRNEIDRIQKSITYINDHPHRILSTEVSEVKIERISRIDNLVRRSIQKNKGSGPAILIPNIGPVHARIPVKNHVETAKTFENLWLYVNLQLIVNKLIEIHEDISSEIKKSEISSRITARRLCAEGREIFSFISIIKRLLRLPIFSGIRYSSPFDFTSLTLLQGAGYSDAYQAIITLRLGLNIDGELLEYSLMDVNELYEVWCFIELLHEIASILAIDVLSGTFIKINENGLRVKLSKGEKSTIKFVEGEKTIELVYNPQFPGLTGDQRPDIILKISQRSWPSLLIVFDAKYRLDTSEAYTNRYGVAGPPQDAINALHRYRDAIAIDIANHGLRRPVIKGVALFPLNTDESNNLRSSALYHALEVLGIGALPFLPSNTRFVNEWLNNILHLAPEELADFGPPFII